MIMPSGSLAVLALNCFTKSMMFTPCGPRAVPTGGAGVALPAGNCSLTVACTFLAMRKILCVQPAADFAELGDLFYLREIQFHGRRSPENRHRNLQCAAVGIHVFHDARKIREGTFGDAHLLVALKHQ